MTLTREEIVAAIAARKAELQTIDVPEWGGDVRIRRMTAEDMEQTGVLSGGNPDFVAILARSLCDEDGKPLFSVKQMQALRDADLKVTLRVVSAILEANGLGDAELKEMVAGFDAAPRDDSSTS